MAITPTAIGIIACALLFSGAHVIVQVRRRRCIEREQSIRDKTMREFAARIRDGELGIQFAVGLRDTPYFAEFETDYKEMLETEDAKAEHAKHGVRAASASA